MAYKMPLALFAAVLWMAGSPASATDRNFFLHLGPGALILDDSAKIKVGGVTVPKASVTINDHVTPAFEIGYFFTKNWALSFTGGVPPEPTVKGAGSVKGLGELGSIVYGPTALTTHYHFDEIGSFRPYVGGGAMFMLMFENHSKALNKMQVEPSIGAVAQVGTDVMFTDRFGAYFDVKKAYLRTTATGELGGAPVKADVRIDPLVLSAGLALRF